jgi:flagellar motor switch protein FliM
MSDIHMTLHTDTSNASDDDDSSSMDHDPSQSSNPYDTHQQEDETKQRSKAFLEREEKHVRRVRVALVAMILICATVVSTSVYMMTRRSEHRDFEQKVCLYANIRASVYFLCRCVFVY